MAELNEEQLKRAETRGRKMLETEPRAVAAHYDAGAGRVMIDLANGCAYAFPADRVQDLQARAAKIWPRSKSTAPEFNLRWPSLGVDLYVPALVNGVFGNRAWMADKMARWPAGRDRPGSGCGPVQCARSVDRARPRRFDGRRQAGCKHRREGR